MEIQGNSKLDVQLNITPLIDVVFLLLIFYMLTSSLMHDQALEVNLPSSSTSASVEKQPIIINLDKKGVLSFGSEQVTEVELQEKLAQALGPDPTETVVIRSDQEVPVQKLISLMDLSKKAGAKSISIATQAGS